MAELRGPEPGRAYGFALLLEGGGEAKAGSRSEDVAEGGVPWTQNKHYLGSCPSITAQESGPNGIR